MADFYLNERGFMVPCEADLDVTSKSMPDRHLMIDIETGDTEVTAAIFAIGAVVFDPRGQGHDLGNHFSMTIDMDSQASTRTTSEATMAWWDQQSQEAKEATFGSPNGSLPAVLREFSRWVNCLSPTCTRVWAKSPDFDCSILVHAFKQQGLYWPFKFWESRCVRTIMELAYPEGDFPHVIMEGPAHDALADAKKQVIQVQHSYYILGA